MAASSRQLIVIGVFLGIPNCNYLIISQFIEASCMLKIHPCKPTNLLRPAVGRYPLKLILPEFVFYLGERGVQLCVGNG